MRSSWLPWFSVGSSFALLLGLWLLGGVMFAQMEREAEQSLSDLEPRHARLAGLLDEQDRILADLERQSRVVENMAYPSGRDPNRIGADLQQAIRVRVVEAGAEVRGSSVSVAQPEEGEPFGRITVSLTMSGTLGAVRKAFFAIAKMRPVVYPVQARMQAQSLGQAEEGDQLLSLEVRFESLFLARAK